VAGPDPTLRYDEPALLKRLSAAGARARSLFAAACAERLFGHPQEAAWAAR